MGGVAEILVGGDHCAALLDTARGGVYQEGDEVTVYLIHPAVSHKLYVAGGTKTRVVTSTPKLGY